MRALGVVVIAAAVLCLPAAAADFSGDGTGDIAIFRPGSGLWAVRGVTRVYFGTSGDVPVPGDYDGSGSDAPAIFRQSSGLWAVRGVTRVYFGGSTDEPIPVDYTGDGTSDVAIFRPSTGLWAVRGVTRAYFGRWADIPIGRAAGRNGLLKTGQTTSGRDGDDGYYQKGIAFNYQTRNINGDLVTIDNVTGLMWASDSLAAGCNWGNSTDWNSSIDWANNLTFAGYSDWRLSNRRELESIVDSSRTFPSINTTYFPDAGLYVYWSSTQYTGDTTSAWNVYFGYGSVDVESKDTTYRVRAVRAGE